MVLQKNSLKSFGLKSNFFFFQKRLFNGRINSKFLWFHRNIKIDGKCICFGKFSINGLNFVGNLFERSENVKRSVKIKQIFIYWNLKHFSGYSQGTPWNMGTSRKTMKKEKPNLITLSMYDHHLIQKTIQ